MPFTELRWSRTHVELAMDISVTLGDLSQSLETASAIPSFLSQALDLEPLTLAIIAESTAGPQVIFQATSGNLDAGPAFAQNLLAIHQQTRPLSPTDGPTLRHPDGINGLSEMPVEHMAHFPRATVLSRSLDAKHQMLLIVHQHIDDSALSAGLLELLQLVSDKLARLLGCLIAWRSQSDEVGPPFSRLTDREWVVLQGLTSDAGEKQLADQLGLSPHTLHSHIKSIYRKVGVQGRLLLLARVREAIRGLRSVRIGNTKKVAPQIVEKSPAIAVG